MSIQTELSRIINAKAAIKTAIEGKGVTVPEATLLDGMASLIESIEVGGSGAKIAVGEFTPASNLTNYTVTHNLGELPTFKLLMSVSESKYQSLGTRATLMQIQWVGHGITSGSILDTELTDGYSKQGGVTGYGSQIYGINAGWKSSNTTTTTKFSYNAVGPSGNNILCYLAAGTTYRWIVGVIE